MKITYRIYPGIGVARIGNSDQFIIGPESPTKSVTGPFKENGKVKKQAARFRIYEIQIDDFGEETILSEISSTSNISIDWEVHLVNRKAASREIPQPNGRIRNSGYDQNKLVIESQDSISGLNQRNTDMIGAIEFVKNNQLEGRDDVVLGRLETDEQGRLLVIGGNGVSRSPIGTAIRSFANNPGWYDDCCDGPVTATIKIDGQQHEVEPAWLVVGSPAFAPNIQNIVTWYDQAKNIDVQHYNPGKIAHKPSFTKDVYPILKSVSLLSWVSEWARMVHASGGSGDFLSSTVLFQLADNSNISKALRKSIVERLMPPNTNAPDPQVRPNAPKNMPYLFSGMDPDDLSKYQFASLTRYQYTMMEKWADGDFNSDWVGPPEEFDFDSIQLKDQPAALDEAALRGCIGGPFFPGIESTFLMANSLTYEAPYRIDRNHQAGYLTELMALPWQADYRDCGQLWWPAQRPVSVKTLNGSFLSFSRTSGGGDMSYSDIVKHWNDLGFIVEDDHGEFVETERGNIP